MWQLIQSNQRKSIILVVAMAVCLLLLGYVIGMMFDPARGGLYGLLVAFVVWLVMSLVSFYSGDSILLAVSGAKEVTPDIHPQLFNVVEEIKIAANLPVMPRIFIMPESAPNAFATGIKPERSAIAVTTGLLSKLNRDELQGVIAHEISHIINRDVLYMTMAGVMLGSIALITQVFTRGMWYTGSASRRYRSGSIRGGGQIQVLIFVLSIIFIILAPILAQLLYFSLSRKREYLADASGVRLTRYPEGLASALEKIAASDSEIYAANEVTAAMFIENPFTKENRFTSLLGTHPPIRERIKILRHMSQGASLANYETAFRSVKGNSAAAIPAMSLQDEKEISLRAAHADAGKPFEEPESKESVRDATDLLRAVSGFAFLACTCGIKFKVPADFNRPEIICPRCSRITEVPFAILAGAAMVHQGSDASGQKTAEEPQVYKRKGEGWESFSCRCTKLLQLSPQFLAPQMTCSACGRTTLIQ